MEENQGATGNPKDITLSIVNSLQGALIDSQVEVLNKTVSDDFLTSSKARPDYEDFPVRIFQNSLGARLENDINIYFDEIDTLQVRRCFLFCHNRVSVT
ncbi:MAG: hypothetical protein LBR11_10665 [Deltaproteobacteria bacterium]|jgi:hypothetical protein|nr:hypothetical protein [Deltaproteobacteria bacterium]